MRLFKRNIINQDTKHSKLLLHSLYLFIYIFIEENWFPIQLNHIHVRSYMNKVILKREMFAL